MLPAGDVISENPEALEVLKDALCFNVQEDEAVVDHITQLRQVRCRVTWCDV